MAVLADHCGTGVFGRERRLGVVRRVLDPVVPCHLRWAPEDDPLEPQGFGAGQVPDQADGRPAGRKHGRVQLGVLEIVDDRDDGVALLVEEVLQPLALAEDHVNHGPDCAILFAVSARRSREGNIAPMSLPTPTLPTPTLHTPRLRLRPVASADADALFALHSSARVLRYWDAPPWNEPARAERFIAAGRQMAEEGSGARVAIDRVFDGIFIGWISLTSWNPAYRSALLGYCLDDAAWGYGYATEAARALLQWAFDALDLNRVQAETDTRNAASARVLEKLGFLREGTLREDCVVNGEVSDSWVYGLLRREWRPTSGSDAHG
jgi:ribosomal-protein-alanine N-acetyltransferase